MADPNDSPDEHAQHAPSPNSPPEPALPEIVEAEPVDEPQRTTTSEHQDTLPPHPQNDEAFRQYQQFLEFQRFQEWQRLHGSGAGTTPPPGPPNNTAASPKRPLWKKALRLLRFKPVRRLLYLLLAFLLLPVALDHYFGNDSGSGSGGTPGAAEQGARPILQTSPKAAVITVYDFVATKPDTVCSLFTPPASSRFAAAHGAPNCPTAAQQLSNRVTSPHEYKNPDFGEGAVKVGGADASVSSCLLDVRGGPRLGTFGLKRKSNGGWIIDGYERQPSCTGG
ncbi:hypothetical protein [Haloactinomyces albus]|uniref:hypothetical protein n=1 Tax=Haloactinomyces albus TaxID=1352928 RepID=UPI00286D1B33|nr:hypothetical protein [Haloactinomyces albus]